MNINLTWDDTPTAIMGLAGLLLILLGLKGQDKAAIKLSITVIALGLMTAAMWWHIRRH
jgi:hypothetical protein